MTFWSIEISEREKCEEEEVEEEEVDGPVRRR
jgi:hypothetical protein